MSDKYLMWGTGERAICIYQFIKNMGCKDNPEIVAFVDNNKEKWGQIIDGIKIIPPSDIKKIDFDYIYIASTFFKEIKLQIEKLGIENKKIKDILSDYWNKIAFFDKSHALCNYKLSIVTIMKNFSEGIEEWLEYYLIIGVSHFYIYDNDSIDNFREKLKNYINKGIVTYNFFPGDKVQKYAYNHAICHYKYETEYMAFVDDDEFIVPIEDKLLPDVIDEIIENNKYSLSLGDKSIGGIGVNWRMYGTSFHIKKQIGLTIENYIYRAKDLEIKNKTIKTICNPRVVKGFLFNPHACIYKDGYCCINEKGYIIENAVCEHNSCKIIRINHYYSKSEEELLSKFERGWPNRGHDKVKKDFIKENFFLAKNNYNEVKDVIMERYINKVRKKLFINNL